MNFRDYFEKKERHSTDHLILLDQNILTLHEGLQSKENPSLRHSNANKFNNEIYKLKKRDILEKITEKNFFFISLVNILVDNKFVKFDSSFFSNITKTQILRFECAFYKWVIEVDFFSKLVNLRELGLSSCGISEIQPNAFCKLSNLTKLELKLNSQLRKINSNTFNGLTNLKTLILGSSGIQYIAEDAFDPLVKLNRLDLSYTKLRTIKANWFNKLVYLKELNMKSCLIENIECGAFISLSNLDCLDLSGNKFHILDNYYFTGLKNLFYLNLNDCSIKEVRENAFDGLYKLRTIDFRNNFVQIFNKPFCFLKNLHFDVGQDKVTVDRANSDVILINDDTHNSQNDEEDWD